MEGTKFLAEAFKDTFAVLVVKWKALAVVFFLYRDPQDAIYYICKLLYSLCFLVLPIPKLYFLRWNFHRHDDKLQTQKAV